MRVALVLEICPDSGLSIGYLLERLYVWNLAWLMARRGRVPPLYRSGVRYRREPWQGILEEFASIPVVLARGWGDCDDLACWRAAELSATGVPAVPVVRETPQSRPGARAWHVTVQRQDGATEDPSAILGMRTA